MGKLGTIYESIENPLNNPKILQQIVLAYSKSNRTNIFGSSNLYSSMVKMNQTKDNSSINLKDKETFLVKSYNQWIENMINLDDKQIEYLETSRGMDAKEMQEYLKSFGKVTTMKDIERLKSNALFEKEINDWQLNDGWEHIKSQYISARVENRIPVKHRLYVGCQNQDMWKLAELFKEKCEEQGIPFYFKLGSSGDRDDKMVIYADTDNLANYITALQDIARENPEILQRCGEPPAITGKIDGWIGIGDEPPKKENGKNQSYNSLRADIFENAIEETLLSDITEFKGKNVEYKGDKTTFNDVFMEQVAQTILSKLDKNKDKYSGRLSNYGLKEEDLLNEKFKEHIRSNLRKTIQKGLIKLVEVKDIKEQLGGSNGEEIFSIPTRNGKTIPISTDDMDVIIKSMIPVMQEIDPDFMEKAKRQTQEKCKQNGIDDTFCFQQGTKEKFEQMDLDSSEKATSKTNVEDTKPTEIQITPVKTQRQKKSNVINSADFDSLLNQDALKQEIELANGAKISARQYIQEIVAPHIPSNGKYILNNGLQISAKQYIEEYILSEGQKKYKGDIGKLLSENTKSNDGTIDINGKKINSIDIVNSINPELMKRNLKLPNGVEISAIQYIQEIVAPHIPSDGKFVLKSNGLVISAKQFIEEAVMFEGQEKYNGDITALLEAMTVSNNGIVSIDTKESRGQGLEQIDGKSKEQFEVEQRGTEEQKIEQQTEYFEEKISDEKSKTIKLGDMQEGILESKIDSSETDKAMEKIKKINQIKRLMVMYRTNQELTPEQKLLVEEHIKNTQNNIIYYQQKQNNQRKKRNGIEM